MNPAGIIESCYLTENKPQYPIVISFNADKSKMLILDISDEIARKSIERFSKESTLKGSGDTGHENNLTRANN